MTTRTERVYAPPIVIDGVTVRLVYEVTVTYVDGDGWWWMSAEASPTELDTAPWEEAPERTDGEGGI